MGTRYRYFTPDGGPPSNGLPPGLEPPAPTMFCPQFPAGGPPYCGPPPPGYGCFPCFRPLPVPPGFGPPGPNPHGYGLPARGPMICFPEPPPPPPPYRPVPQPWEIPRPIPVRGPPVPDLASQRPPPGARVNGEIAKFNNQQGHIHSKNNTTFHVSVVGSPSRPGWPGGFQKYTCASAMNIQEFIEQVGAIEKAPLNTPRELIGIQEEIEEGDGRWKVARQLRLGDPKLTTTTPDGESVYLTLEQLGWSAHRGQAGKGKPVFISYIPQF